jgi:hypothetical protein
MLIFILIQRPGNEQGLMYLFYFEVDTVLLEEQLNFKILLLVNNASGNLRALEDLNQSHFLSPQHDFTNLASGLGGECHIQGL